MGVIQGAEAPCSLRKGKSKGKGRSRFLASLRNDKQSNTGKLARGWGWSGGGFEGEIGREG